MIISHSNNFAFFRNPKTGSTTAEFFLRLSTTFDPGDKISALPQYGFGNRMDGSDALNDGLHLTPQEAIDGGYITLPQLQSYNAFAFLRDPYERVLAGLIHGVGRHTNPTDLLGGLSKHTPAETKSKMGVLLSKQYDYFHVDGQQVVTPLLMTDFKTNLRNIIALISPIDFPVIPNLNSREYIKARHPDNEWFTTEFIAFVDNEFAEDIAFYNSV